ncbi:hypothetical protein B296_00024838 [Ensete ventricosum]|uniref:Uncharacterized protein n=1 Tax=Ensete ventricosum TaxID=4639 RepID=A0A426YU39_ENSVE|nr:hypothetical protein B296_00024838 [Ensete ventricosum]
MVQEMEDLRRAVEVLRANNRKLQVTTNITCPRLWKDIFSLAGNAVSTAAGFLSTAVPRLPSEKVSSLVCGYSATGWPDQ